MKNFKLMLSKITVKTKKCALFVLFSLSCIFIKSKVRKPIIITGCGRSGTTILGMALSHHSSVAYINEPKHFWIRAYPQYDIWSKKASKRSGNLYLTANDCMPSKSIKLSKMFHFEMYIRNKSRLLIKQPIDNFRLDFINTIFPDALFIHIIRNGLEVASSIEKIYNHGRWYGINDYKWKQLTDYASRREKYRYLLNYVKTGFDRGLLEWRLSVEAANDFFQSMPESRYLQVKYEDLVKNPVSTLERIQSFAGLHFSEEVKDFGKKNIKRQKPAISCKEIVVNSKKIAGDLLSNLGYLDD